MNMNVMGKGFIKASMLPTKISSCHQASLRHTYTPAPVRLCSEHRRLCFPCQLLFSSGPLSLLLPSFSDSCYTQTGEVEKIWE